MTEWRCLDKPRIKKAVEESQAAFDPMDDWCCFEEFEHYMKLLEFRIDLFGIEAVIDHAERYRYRVGDDTMDAVIKRIYANAFSME